MPENQETPRAATASLLEWLEGGLHEVKSQTAQLLQQVERTAQQLWDIQERLRRAEETHVDLATSVAVIAQLQGEVRQLRDQLGYLLEQQSAGQARSEELARIRQEESQHLRQEWEEVLRRLDDLEGRYANQEPRLPILEEALHRLQDQLQRLPALFDQMGHRLEAIEGRADRNLDIVKRLENELTRVDGELDNLRKQDEVIGERVQVYISQVRRLEEGLAVLEEDQTQHQELLQRIEMGNLERQRLEERLAALEERARQQQEGLGDQARLLNTLEGKDRLHQERLASLQQQVGEFRQQVKDTLGSLSQSQENQKKRQIAALEQEIREIRQHGLRIGEE